ncbi:hypothetical protein [Rubritalea tangerina]|uniref:DUF1795 domain-containing protein n=1 Tax=Rubritalea tangerina TaxID=430798 RepID=A0ABW4Z8N9_9BACT
MKALLYTLTSALIISASVNAAVIPEGTGIIYGKDHVFSLKAPKKWMLDNESAAKQGVHAVFYKQGGSWENSTTVAYARARPIDSEVKSIEDAVKYLIKDFKQNGNPNYAGKKVKTLKSESGNKGTIYHFSGDQWGNYEAVCYFKENKTINMIILTGRNKKDFESSLKAFESLCKSYLFIGEELKQTNKN